MKVGIVGLGLIGGSVALKLKEVNNNITIYGFDQNNRSLDFSLKNEIIDKKFDPDSLLDFDYLFLAIPVESIKKQLKSILDKISEKTLVIDLGSTKYEICNSIKNHNKRENFLAAHPIAGTEFSGHVAAKKDLFDNKKLGTADIAITMFDKNIEKQWSVNYQYDAKNLISRNENFVMNSSGDVFYSHTKCQFSCRFWKMNKISTQNLARSTVDIC